MFEVQTSNRELGDMKEPARVAMQAQLTALADALAELAADLLAEGALDDLSTYLSDKKA
jgi:hypothetical protein